VIHHQGVIHPNELSANRHRSVLRRGGQYTNKERGMTWQRFVVMLVTAVALSACGSIGSYGNEDAGGNNGIGQNSGNGAGQPEPESAERPDDGEPVVVAGSAFGDILTDGEGRTLYLFKSDTNGTSTCVDDCEATWPPLLGDVVAGDGVDNSQLGSTQRADGTAQATYAGHPLYYFSGDQADGDTNGQGIGDVWFVVGPDGSAITGAGANGADDGANSADQGGSSGYDY
jgi:predicted lipoprotein with Yx(FWY)xxD motif